MNIRRIPVIRATVESLELLKATAKKMVTVPGYTRSDGRVVAAHQKMVHYDPNKLFADVASGKGSHSQKKAHAALQAKDWWQNLSVDDKAIVVMSLATDMQEKASASAAVSGWKKNAVAGKNPTVAQWQAFLALPAAQQGKLYDTVGGNVLGHLKPAAKEKPAELTDSQKGSIKYWLLHGKESGYPAADEAAALFASLPKALQDQLEAEDAAEKKKNADIWASVLGGDEPAAEPDDTADLAVNAGAYLASKEARKPAPAAPVPDVISQDEIDAHSKLAAMESGPHYQKVAIAKLKADAEWQKLPPAEKHQQAMALYQSLQSAASQAAAVSVAKKAMKAGKVPSKAQYLALVAAGMSALKKINAEVGPTYLSLMQQAAAKAGDAGVAAAAKLVKEEVQKAKDAADAGWSVNHDTNTIVGQIDGHEATIIFDQDASPDESPAWSVHAAGSEYAGDTPEAVQQQASMFIPGVALPISKMHQMAGSKPAATKPADDGPKDGDTKPGADGTLIFKDGRWRKVADLVVPGFKLIVDDGNEAFLEEMLQTKLLLVNAAYVQDALAKLKAESAAPKPTVTVGGGAYTVEASYPAGANDLSATVVKNSAGKYAVAFKMPDGKGIGDIKIFSSLDDAKAYAKAIVDGKAPPKLASVKRMKIGESLVKPAMSAVAAPSAPVDKPATFLINTTDGHSKQWSMSVNGNKVMTQWGKIGAKQQTNINTYGTKTEAYIEANKLLKKKKAGGYVAGADGHHQWDEGDLDAVKVVPDPATEKPKTEKVFFSAPAALVFPPKPYGVKKKDYLNINEAAMAGDWEKVAVIAKLQTYTYEDHQATEYAKTVLALKPKDGPKEGDTKQGVAGLLVLKDGHWVLANPDDSFKLKTKGKTQKSLHAQVPFPDAYKASFYKKALKAAVDGDLAGLLAAVSLAEKYNLDIPHSKKNTIAVAKLAGLSFPAGSHDDVAAPAAAAPAPKVQKVAATDAPTAAAAPKAAHKLVSVGSVKVQSMDAWKQTGPQAGSNPGGQFTDKAGGKWYVKFPKTSDHAKNELLAAKLYEMLGVAGPKLKLVAKNGQIGVASKWVEGTKQATPDKLKALDGALSNFAIDAWLSNWDVVGTGYDNLKVGPDGKAIRIDAGGSLLYRAQGEPKGDAFGDTVTELDSLLDAGKNSYSAAVFSGVTKEQMLPGLQQLAKLKPSQIETMVDQIGPGTADQKAALAKKLIARRAHILSKFGVEDPWNKPPPDEAKLPVDKAKLPKPIDFSNINGKPLSSKPHVNAQNSKDSAALVNFAGRGNLTALKSYKYDAVDKETGAALGKKPIVDHPAQLVKKQWIELVEHLQSIAYPTADTLSMPSLGIGGGSAYEIADAVGYYKPVDRVGTISAENRMGFFMKLASVDSVDDAIAESNWHWLSSSSKFMKDSKATYQNYSKTTKAYISNVQASGWINRVWSKGEVGNVSGVGMSKEKLLAELYKDATELPDGMMLWRWMSDSEGSTVKSLMNAKPGDSFQNTDSMCSSFKESWGNSSHFGNAIRLKIRCAKGSKAILSYGSGGFASEGEFTTLPGARFVVVSTKKGIPGNANGVDVECIMLPPDEGYVAEVNKLASITKSITIRSLWQQNPNRSKPPRQSLRRLVRTRSLDMTS